jgi:hypothetical protein
MIYQFSRRQLKHLLELAESPFVGDDLEHQNSKVLRHDEAQAVSWFFLTLLTLRYVDITSVKIVI